MLKIVCIILLATGVLGYSWIRNEYTAFNKESDKLRNDYIGMYKRTIQNEVSRQIEYARYMMVQT
ncbi:MAG: hypothetical protein ACOZCL_06305 [Bacillota bacterium]